MHTCPLRSGPLRFASFGAHGCVHACFATHARSILTRGYSCPLKPQIGQTFFLRGQPPLIVSARLLVARANRAVTVFASFSSLVPTLSIVCAVCSSFAPPHSSVTLIRFTQHPFFIPGQEPSFAHSFRFVPFILPLRNPASIWLHPISSLSIQPLSSIPPQTAILYTPLLSIAHSGTCLSRHKLRLQKTAPALPHAAAFRCPHFVAGFLLPAPSLHSLTARASPFGFAKKSTPLRSAAFSLAFGRLKAALPALFPLRPHTAPDHPPLKKSQSNFIPTQKPIPIQFEINIFSKNKKENAKIAPFQALRQGQALRVCYTKISTPSGSIFVCKTLTQPSTSLS